MLPDLSISDLLAIQQSFQRHFHTEPFILFSRAPQFDKVNGTAYLNRTNTTGSDCNMQIKSSVSGTVNTHSDMWMFSTGTDIAWIGSLIVASSNIASSQILTLSLHQKSVMTTDFGGAGKQPQTT